MRFEPVEINIRDDFKYGMVAFLVDTPDFIECIVEARKELGLENPISRVVAKKFTYSDKLNSKLKETFINKGKIPKNLVKFKENCFDVFADIYQSYIGYYPYFSDVIFFSIVCNCVIEKDIKAQPLFFNVSELFNFKQLGFVELGQPGGIMTIYPFTSDGEVLNLLHKYKKGLKAPDTISNIRRDRTWFWQHVTGLSYQQIWEAHEGEDKPFDRGGVIKAIKQYEKRLVNV